MPGILEFYNNFKFSNPQDNFVPLSELKKHQQELVTYYYRNSQKASDAEKRVYAFGQFLELCKDNKVSREELIKLDSLLAQGEDEFKKNNTELKATLEALDDKYPAGRLNLQDGTVQYQPGAPTRKQLAEQQAQQQQQSSGNGMKVVKE